MARIALVALLFLVIVVEYENSQGINKPLTEKKEPDTMSVEALEYYGVMFPEVAYAQFQKETGRGKSHLCRNHNNHFGMKRKTGSRWAVGQDEHGHAYYPDMRSSILDYKDWQSRWFKRAKGRGVVIKSNQDYLDFLDCLAPKKDGSCLRYATDKRYTNGVKKLMNDNAIKSARVSIR